MARCVVIGGGVAGLSAAIHARLRGYDVTLLEQGDALGGKAAPVRRDGFTLDPGPSIIILTHIYQEVFRRAGRNPDDYLQFQRLDPFTRVLMDGLNGPLDLPADEEACIQALGRVAPQDEPGLRKLMATLASAAPYVDDTVFAHPIDKPYQLLHPKLARFALHFNPRLTYRQLVDEQIQSPLLRAFFYGFPSYSGQTYDSKAAGALLIPFYMLRHGVWYPKGGIHAIPAAFTRLAQELGVDIQYQAKVTGVATQGRRLTEVHVEGGEAIKADAVICAMDRYTFGPWLQRPEPQTPSYSYYTLHWGLKGERPEVEHHTLLIPSGFEAGFEELYQQRRPPSRPVIYLNNPGRVDPQSAPPGHTNLFAVLTVPAMHDHLDWERESVRLRQITRQELDRFGLGFEDSDIIFERQQDPRYFQSAHGSWRGSLYGPDEKERLWGLFSLGPRDPQFRNLTYAGGTAQPGAGLPMVTLSGKFAADALPAP